MAIDRKITREDGLILFHLDVFPVHPKALKQLTTDGSLDYDIMNDSIDEALDWTYQDVKENPGLINISNGLRDSQGYDTSDIEVIPTWLKSKPHEYYEQIDGTKYRGKDVDTFPIPGLQLVDNGLYLVTTPIIVDKNRGILSKKHIQAFSQALSKEFLPKQVLDEFNIKDNGDAYLIPARWYTKDGAPFKKLFAKNFTTIYGNALIK